MAYTRVWDNSAPPGSAMANTIDTIFQEFRVDTQQRISSILKAGTDIDDDPLQLATVAFGAFTGVQRWVNPFANVVPGATGSSAVVGLKGSDGLAHLTSTGGGGVTGAFDVAVVVPDIPIGAQVISVGFWGYRVSGFGTTSLRLYALNVNTAAYTLLGTIAALPTVYGGASVGPLAAVPAGSLLIARLAATGGAGLSIEVAVGGLQLIYTIPAGDWIP